MQVWLNTSNHPTYPNSALTVCSSLVWCSTETVLHNLDPSPLDHTAVSPADGTKSYGNTWLLSLYAPELHWLVQGNTEYVWRFHWTPFLVQNQTWNCLQGRKVCKETENGFYIDKYALAEFQFSLSCMWDYIMIWAEAMSLTTHCLDVLITKLLGDTWWVWLYLHMRH